MTEPKSQNLPSISRADAIYQIKQRKRRITNISNENKMFSNYLKRVEPSESVTNRSMVVQKTSVGDFTKLGRKKSKPTRISVEVLHLSAEQKCDIATSELEEIFKHIELMKEDSEKKIDAHHAIIEEAEIALSELKKSGHEYERLIAQGAVSKHTGKVMGEKIAKYFEDKVKNRDSYIEKLRLKNSAMRGRIQKVKVHLRQKEEMGEVLHQVDFDQLDIEHKQDMERIMELYEELVKYKLAAGNANQVLSSFKKKLNTLTNESDELKNGIQQRSDILDKLKAEFTVAERDREEANEINITLRQKLSYYRAPEVMDYVKRIASLEELQRVVGSWERKVEIAEMTLKANRSQWKRLLVQTQLKNPWNALSRSTL
ncbi:hypothetical protein LOD99_4966 [Oopsacas minuta]|uniref:Cilia- and flagella-associated protein 263 n=1 Tax=Oopsacas minuta TaxID=111878 RepID=A0AAV7JRU7_9METZ|nr:hypothetical protein LOD99_4966 [Oopsacas minuta]